LSLPTGGWRACLFACLFPLAATAQIKLADTRPAMGTPWHITLYTTDTLTAHRAIDSAFARIEVIEQRTSDYRPRSEINRIVRMPARRYHPISADLYEVLSTALQLSGYSRGTFDPTIGPLTKIWRRAVRQQRFPSQTDIDRARSRVQWQSVRLSRSGAIWLGRDSMQFDLGGIAKGYALDATAEVLRHYGITRFMIDGGGDLLLGEPPPGRRDWKVVTPAGTIDTARVAIASSGAAYRYLLHEHQSYSHVVDPRTGLGSTRAQSVTVIHARATLADGIASTLTLLPQDRWQDILRHYPGTLALEAEADPRPDIPSPEADAIAH